MLQLGGGAIRLYIKTMKSFKKQMLMAFLAGVLALAALGAGLWFSQQGPRMGGDFSLIHEGAAWTFSDHAKPLNLLYVGYAKCPDVCPMALSFSAQAIKQLDSKDADRVQLIFISVDAKNDTAESVSTYAKQFNPSFVGLTGTQESIDQAIKLFGASYMVEQDPKSYLGYSIAHTDRIFILNKKGIVVDSIPSPRSADEIVQKIKENL
ncbi:SCO family protein [Bdellovibrio bacteriovorus]|uniref:SCO family protein n=1 Tax=Bdellovibrio bacteriovorus TaxID=959 RepID=UPI0021CE5098|nr:SCO family protein [Bdellovibrio bacteriovorus]UXR64411.1 SCO family protein [Bdellovibrio bacteriovorus]